MRVLTTLYVTEHRAKVGLHKGNLLVSRPDGKVRVPIETVSAVLLLGGGQVSAQALERCVYRGIRVASLSRHGRLRFAVGGPVTGNVLLRVAQVRAADRPDVVLEIARNVVAGKLRNCRHMVTRWGWDARLPERHVFERTAGAIDERIGSLLSAPDGDTVRGLEGDGTRRYFKCLRVHLESSGVDLQFVSRNRRPPRDEVNALLSFLYGLVLAEVVGACEAAGLDPQVGFLHGLRPGRPSLGLDLLEEFRPAIADRLAVGMVTRRMIRPEHFERTAGRACYLTEVGRRLVLDAYESFKEAASEHRLLGRPVPRWALPSLQATLMARYLRGDLPAYPPFVMAA